MESTYQKIIVGIDSGSIPIRVVIGGRSEEGLKIIGYDVIMSKGIINGEVVDLKSAAAAIRNAVFIPTNFFDGKFLNYVVGIAESASIKNIAKACKLANLKRVTIVPLSLATAEVEFLPKERGKDLADIVNNPHFSTAVGLVLLGAKTAGVPQGIMVGGGSLLVFRAIQTIRHLWNKFV